jgi:tetratricopeptide (TPR) repeat protein
MRKPSLIFPAALLALAAVAGLKLRLDGLLRVKVPGAGVVYVPTGPYVKAASFGYSSFLADVIYVWAIQYYSNPNIKDRFDHFARIFGIIADLDPRWIDPYEVAALIAEYDSGDPELPLKMYDDGAARNPNQWIFPFNAGHYARLKLKDYERAKAYFKKAAETPGAPEIAKRLYADAAFKATDYQTSWAMWREVHETATDPQIRKIASNHLYQVKAAVDIAALKSALARFREIRGRPARTLDELVTARLIRAVPRDFDEKEYIYDSETGEIRTAVIPWKR